MKGIVIQSTGKYYQVKSDDETYNCVVRGKIRLANSKSTNPVAVGDWVEFEGEEEMKRITEVYERKNHLVRKSVNLSKQQHVIGANIDEAILVVTQAFPLTMDAFIDRFLVATEAYGIDTHLVLNKWDLLDKSQKEEAQERLSYYKSLGYKTSIISVETGEGLEDLKVALKDKTVIFSGHSGVGKTSLLNKLQPGLKLRTSEISEQHETGKHTTTYAEMVFTDFDARIIDSPGIKGFGLVGIEREEFRNYFRDFRKFDADCHFHNCLHLSEPKCAVKQAIVDEKIKESRYDCYLTLMEDEADHFRKSIYG